MTTFRNTQGKIDAKRLSVGPNGDLTVNKIGDVPQLVITGQTTDVVKRAIPADGWKNGTGFVWIEDRLQNLNTGLQRENAISSVVAATTWWYSGDGRTNTQAPSHELAGKLRAKIKDQNVNLAQTLAEYRQTADLFSNVVTSVWRTFRSLRSGRALTDIARYFSSPRNRIERDVANRWLQYQYGVKPLVSDLYGSVEELNKSLVAGKMIRVAVGEKQFLQGTHLRTPGGNPLEGVSHWFVSHDMRYEARYIISDSSVKQLSQVGITNPLLLAWEVIPYSFVVDWLFPVGNYLSALDALVGTTDFSYYEIRRTRKKSVLTAYGSSAEYEYRSYHRNGPFTNLALPRLRYKPSTSLTKVLNGMALLKQLRP